MMVDITRVATARAATATTHTAAAAVVEEEDTAAEDKWVATAQAAMAAVGAGTVAAEACPTKATAGRACTETATCTVSTAYALNL
jgi:hypothetical protein